MIADSTQELIMDHVKDSADALARKRFMWTLVYAVLFAFGVLLILKN